MTRGAASPRWRAHSGLLSSNRRRARWMTASTCTGPLSHFPANVADAGEGRRCTTTFVRTLIVPELSAWKPYFDRSEPEESPSLPPMASPELGPSSPPCLRCGCQV